MNLSTEKYRNKIAFAETLFTVDAKKGVLFEHHRPSNRLGFADMRKFDEGYGLNFNTLSRKITPVEPTPTENDIPIFLPYAAMNFFPTLSPQQKDDYSWQSYVNGHRYMLFGELFERRICGMLPLMKYRDEQYSVDVRNEVLIHMPDKSKTISFKDLTFLENITGYNYLGFFKGHPNNMIHSPIEKLADLEGTTGLLLPEMKRLDPIGVAMKEGKPAHHYLSKFPLVPEQHLITYNPSVTTKIEFLTYQRYCLQAKNDQATAKKKGLIRNNS